MSRKYKHGDIVPTDVLADRLGVLAQYIADGIDNRKSHFYMSIPAELDRDADLVMSATASRLREYEAEIAKLKAAMRVLAKCSDEDIAKLKELCSRANNYMRLMDGEEFELDQGFGTLKDELREAAK